MEMRVIKMIVNLILLLLLPIWILPFNIIIFIKEVKLRGLKKVLLLLGYKWLWE